MSTPKVSVAMIAYNHERFVAQAIESVLAQRVDFPIEIVFGEDCSTDNTRQVVRELAANHPNRFNLLLPEKNIGMNRNLAATIQACRGEYIALLEGDDYWIDSEKLQQQAQFLDANPECAICFTRADVVDEHNQPVDAPAVIRQVKERYSLEDYLSRVFQPRTCTVMFRRGLFTEFPEWYFSLPVGDFPLHVLNTQHGHFGFLDRKTAAYRIHSGGIWSLGFNPNEWQTGSREQLLRTAARLSAVVRLYETVATYLGDRFRPIMREQIGQFAHSLAMTYGGLHDWPRMRECVWKQIRNLPLPKGVPVSAFARELAVSHFPFLARVLRTYRRAA